MTKDEYAKIVGKRELNSVIQNLETEIQNITDEHIKDLNIHQENKEKELMEV